jgi:mannose-6-phosphate isomerase
LPLPRPIPVRFEPVLLEKVWGGDRLVAWGKPVAPGAHIGESWELADLDATSASGAGGAGICSRIASGAAKGHTLRELMAAWTKDLHASSSAAFPLLIKFLDAQQDLSVQVHPSPAYAAAHPECKLKTEAWMILAADPGSVIYKGVKHGITHADLHRGAHDGSIVAMLEAVPAVAGHCHNLPSGTVHALGRGVLVAEVQTPSDTTFRLFDWGRAGRELHIDAAIECASLAPAPPAIDMSVDMSGNARVLATDYFEICRVNVAPGDERSTTRGRACTIIMVLDGAGDLSSDEGDFPAMRLRKGETVLIPACHSESAQLIAPEDSRLTCLCVQIPTR